jgi:hypothetical protein
LTFFNFQAFYSILGYSFISDCEIRHDVRFDNRSASYNHENFYFYHGTLNSTLHFHFWTTVADLGFVNYHPEPKRQDYLPPTKKRDKNFQLLQNHHFIVIEPFMIF